MNADRWRRISEVYHAVRDHEPPERPGAIAERCGGDDSLRREVESLLHHGMPSTPAFDVVTTELPELPDGLLGATLDGYVIESLVGEGGMGRVYRARDLELGRSVAIKVLPPELAADGPLRARLDREAQLLATLNHPNIAAIYGVADGAGIRGLVLEFVEGETLAQRIERAGRSQAPKGRMPVPEVIRIARQLAEALDAAHEGGVIHRDLKPANIKLTTDGAVKVLDFGLAKALDDSGPLSDSEFPTAMTQAGVILGTVMYMSPEQARGRPVGKRTDIWSFGCVLYEMLAGRPAFDGETTSDVLAAVIDRSPDWQALPADTPKGLEQLLRRCLEKDARHRLRDIGDSHELLEAASTPPAIETGVAEPPPSRGRERLAWAAAAAAIIIAIPSIAWQPRQPVGPPEFRRVVRLTSGPDLEFGPALAPDGKWVAYFADVGGKVDIWVKFLTGGVATNLTSNIGLELPTRTAIGGLAISPDGTQIAFDAGERPGTPANLFDSWVISAPFAGTPRKLVERGRAVRWSPDGRSIAYVRAGASAGDALCIAEADATNERCVIDARGGMHVHLPAWSADGRHVYFSYGAAAANDEPSEIYRIAVTGGSPEPVVRTPRRALFAQPLGEGRGMLYAANPLTSDLGVWWHSLTAEATMRPVVAGVGEYGDLSVARDGSAVALLADSVRGLSLLSVERGGTGGLRQLTDGSTRDQDPTVSPGRTEVVFSSGREGSRNLWRIGVDGTGARALTSGPAFDERPVLSPDGRRVAFASDRGGRRSLWVMNADGGAPRLLTPALVFESPSWSPDGRQLVYSANAAATQELTILDVDTGAATRLATPGPATAPVWSPSGEVIAYIEAQPSVDGRPSSSRVAVIRRDGTTAEPRLLEGPNVLNGFIAWSPDGRHVAAFVEPGAAASSVWVLDSRGIEAPFRAATMPPSTRVRGGAWLPDGKTLIIGQTRRVTDVVLLQP